VYRKTETLKKLRSVCNEKVVVFKKRQNREITNNACYQKPALPGYRGGPENPDTAVIIKDCRYDDQ